MGARWTARKSCSLLGALDRGTPRQLLKLVPLERPALCCVGAPDGAEYMSTQVLHSHNPDYLPLVIQDVSWARTLDG